MRSIRLACTALIASSALVVAACGGSSDGDEGLISFTPLDCGRTGCTFEDPIAVGGTLALHIVGSEGVATAGLDVRPSDTSKLAIEVIPDVGGRPTWELTAMAEGDVTLEVIDPPSESGDEAEVIDTLTINIASVSRLGLQNFIGDAVGPGAPSGGFDEVWTVNADSPVSFRVTPFDANDVAAMGRFEYTVTLDAMLESSLIDFTTSEGRLYVRPPAGSWSAEWMGPNASLTAQIVAE